MSTRLRVLILEDRAADAELMLHVLRVAGFDPAWERVDGEEDFVARLDPSLEVILADYSLPQFNALRALHRLQERRLDIPFIVVTASVSEEVAVECMRQGAADYLLKDRLSRLGQAVRHALAARETREQRRRAEEALRKGKDELELRVAERTGELRDVNERLTVELGERQRAQEALRFLSDASKVLSSSLDNEVTLENVAHLAIPHLADCCSVRIRGEDGTFCGLAVAHVDPAKVALLREAQRRHVLDMEAPQGVAKVLRTGLPELYPDIGSALPAQSPDEAQCEIVRRLGVVSAMIVPLIAGTRTLGVISLMSAESGRHYGKADLDLAMEWARRAALALDNTRLYREAQEAITLRDKVLASISHDLKNPLTSIKAAAQLLARRIDQKTVYDMQQVLVFLERIDAKTTSMNALIGELLDVARLQMGQPLELQRAKTNLLAVVHQVIDDHQESVERHPIRIDTAVSELIGDWDPLRIERVAANLLSNAVKYSPDGGTITVRFDGEEQADGSWAVLAVSDEGLGIPAADLPRIFEQFHRARNVIGRIAGTGVGLATTRQIVEQHGGTISVVSEEGKGSTFTVRLPMCVQVGAEPVGTKVQPRSTRTRDVSISTHSGLTSSSGKLS